MSRQKAFTAWMDCVMAEQPGVLATILQTESSITDIDSKRMFISKEGKQIGDLGELALNESIIELAIQKLNEKNPKSELKTFLQLNGSEVNVFIDVNMPPLELMIFGAGHDAIPVANCSISLGLKTIIVDSRSFYNSAEYFPNTIRIVSNTKDFQEKVKIEAHTHIIVMNHHFEKDKETLKFVLQSAAPYIGLLGPLSRSTQLFDALANDGVYFSREQLIKLHSPVGLDIGAVTPEEIAFSILAEVIAIKNNRPGGFLKGIESIH